jgi:hypothetical protein
MTKKERTYEEFVEEQPLFSKVVSKDSWDYLTGSNEKTTGLLSEEWKKNIRRNKKFFRKHGGVAKDLIGMGKNRAVIAVGAGASFNKNCDVLKRTCDIDGLRSWESRHYIILASNHQFKPLLKMGIIPDFVMCVDSSDKLYDQMCTDIPEIGQHTILITGVHASYKVNKGWDKQGRDIRFYIPTSAGIREAFEEVMGKNAEPNILQTGGNVLNSAWALSLKFFQSSVFMCVGNDLSYELDEDPDIQRAKYYADGDYSTNAPGTGSGRDEASGHKVWQGFSYHKSPVLNADGKPIYNIEIDLVGTTNTLWVYKIWVEGQCALNLFKLPFHFYNCSEGGICGVLCKDDSIEGREKDENWFLLDEVCKRYHTRRLEDAVAEFSSAKESMHESKMSTMR